MRIADRYATACPPGLLEAWRARRAEREASRAPRATATPTRPAPAPVQEEAEQVDEMAVVLNDLLKRWHQWQAGYNPVPTCSADPMFRNVKSSKNWDTTSQVIADELHGSTMETIEAQVAELPDVPQTKPYRSAIYAVARNLSSGASVWKSPRLPADLDERAVVIMEARNMLTRRLMAAGVL